MYFASLTEKFAKFFGSTADGSSIPQIPEKFLKGQIAKLAEEIVKELLKVALKKITELIYAKRTELIVFVSK
jgi:hypothetical protein